MVSPKPSQRPARRARALRRVEELGRALERAWRERRRAAGAFPGLALRALRAGALGRHFTVPQLLVWAAGDHGPRGSLTAHTALATRSFPLFETDGFAVELLIWTEGPATLAGVSGALELLTGGSLHCTGRSEHEEELAPGFFVGRTSRTRLEILRPGSRLALTPRGGRFHILAHFDRPAAAILIHADAPAAPAAPAAPVWRVRYRSPCGTASLDESPALRRRFDALSTLRTLDAERFWKEWTRAAAGMDLPLLFLVLFRLCGERDRARVDEVLRRARATHGAKVDRLLAVCEEHLRQAAIVERWTRARRVDHGFLFAVLLLAQDRRQVLQAIRARHPRRDPVDVLVAWLRELARTAPGERGGNGLDLPLNEVTTRVLELTARGATFARLLRALRRDFDVGDADTGLVRRAHEIFRTHAVFRNLCADRRSSTP